MQVDLLLVTAFGLELRDHGSTGGLAHHRKDPLANGLFRMGQRRSQHNDDSMESRYSSHYHGCY